MKSILVTGCAGFIGYHISHRLLNEGHRVWGLDNLNPYYDVELKKARLARISGRPQFRFIHADLADRQKVMSVFQETRFDAVLNMAAQAGVRHSLTDPFAYADSNLAGFVHVLEGCRRSEAGHLVFASSSSVYGANARMPYSTHDNTDHPLSLYAASKKANEVMAHAYAHLYGLPCTGLRFFTVYGPWGRPDMALFIFAKAILSGEPLELFNSGRMRRDLTYIDDIVEAVVRVMERVPAPDPNWSANPPDPASSSAPFRLYNVGNHQPVELLTLIRILEAKLGKKAQVKMLPLQPGDAPATCADVADLERDIGFRPQTPIEAGAERFIEWFRSYYRI
ncbi:MAG: NAD-dependent epimerase [Terriglobia bacterium]